MERLNFWPKLVVISLLTRRTENRGDKPATVLGFGNKLPVVLEGPVLSAPDRNAVDDLARNELNSIDGNKRGI